MTMQGIEFKHLKLSTNRIAEDYLAGRQPAIDFLGGPCQEATRLGTLAETVDKRLDRKRAAAVLESQRSFRLVGNGRQLLDEFVKKRGFCVVSGQQPVLFGGPLYVLYKCVSVIKTARECSEVLGRPVLPVFWNASEDHDLAEASSVSIPGMGNELASLSLPVEENNYNPLCQIALGENLAGVRSRLEELTPETEFRPELLKLLDESYTAGNDFGHAFSELLVRLFAGYGLFVVDACSPEIRRGASHLFEQEIFDSESSARLFAQTSRELEQAGYPVQITPQDQDTALFVLRHGRRVKLQRSGSDSFSLKGVGKTLTAEELKTMLRDTPEVFSPGVRARPLVEARFSALCAIWPGLAR